LGEQVRFSNQLMLEQLLLGDERREKGFEPATGSPQAKNDFDA
jgi:hypothetical protein